MRRPLSPTLAKVAKEELNETPDRIQQDIVILRAWIRQQPHLRARTEDDFLIAFLRRTRYSLEETKRLIDRYFSNYKLFPEIMRNRCITQRLLDINRMGLCLFPHLPKCSNRSAVVLARMGRCDADFTLREIYQFTSMAFEIVALENDYASVGGICEIIDLEEANMDKRLSYNKLLHRKWWNWLHECSPLRVKEMYFINVPKDFQSAVMFIFNKLNNQVYYPIHILRTTAELLNHIDRECLPEEYGGTNGRMVESIAHMEDLLNSYRSYFEQDRKYGTIEKLRAGEITTNEAEFGVNGSFRSLNWD